ncbi:MAG: type IX secretion system membrane protein PorP/SprF [Flavobacteriales bacterium]|nr:type IX secretion system membrane protein PorP/SprF [Flavobacteriales bacterium]
MFNLLAINPAYAGSAERVSIKALTRHQWVGFAGAPTTQTLTIHSPLMRESLGIGGTIMRDEHGPVTQYGFMVDLAYRIHFGGERKLAFGLKGGMNLVQGRFGELSPLQQGDQVFQQNVNSKLDPQFGFGMMYYGDRFYLGLSAPKLLRTEFFEDAPLDTTGSAWQQGQRPHYFLVSFDLSANFFFFEKFWLGAMYRHQDAVGALAQYYFTDGISVGYSYDYPISILRNYSGGSHEVMLGFDFGRKLKGIRSPRYF